MKSNSKTRGSFYDSRAGSNSTKSYDFDNSTKAKPHLTNHEITEDENNIPHELLKNATESSLISKNYHLPKLSNAKEKKLIDETIFALPSSLRNIGTLIEKRNDSTLINNEMLQK